MLHVLYLLWLRGWYWRDLPRDPYVSSWRYGWRLMTGTLPRDEKAVIAQVGGADAQVSHDVEAPAQASGAGESEKKAEEAGLLEMTEDGGRTGRHMQGAEGNAPVSTTVANQNEQGRDGGGAENPGDADAKTHLQVRAVSQHLTSLTLLGSFIADLDVAADWLFVTTGLGGQGMDLTIAAWFFAALGTLLHLLMVCECHAVAKIVKSCGGDVRPRHYPSVGLQLIVGLFLEDIPQVAITAVAGSALTTFEGGLNVTTAAFAAVAKFAEACATRRQPSLPAQLQVAKTDRGCWPTWTSWTRSKIRSSRQLGQPTFSRRSKLGARSMPGSCGDCARWLRHTPRHS